jgi:F0F1-type ATP synthase membrane subunit b/b'
MSKKDNIEKRLRKIEKEEGKAAKALGKRRKDLAKALSDNETMVEQAVTRGRTTTELKLESEIEKMTKVNIFSKQYEPTQQNFFL